MSCRLPIALLVLSLWLSGCVSLSERPFETSTDLDDWVERELNPYLAEQLGRHPKFKGESFLLVAMQGDEVQPEIDGLREEVRVRVFDHLLNVPGVNVAWRPAVRPWQHHRSLAELQCGEGDEVRYYIGIELREEIGGDMRLTVRALDVQDVRWMSGFGKQWRGRLSQRQRAAFADSQPDEYLRGLRPLPFGATQADLTAAYLARNLSCLLQKRSLPRIMVQLERTPGLPAFFETTLGLVGNYLARFREVRITEQVAQANVTLRGVVHHLHDNRYQVWLAVTLKESGERLAGTDTAAYVELPTDQLGSLQSPSVAVRQPPMSRTRPLIESFNLLAPVSQTLCRSRLPWAMGARYLEEGESLQSEDCLGLELTLAEDGWLFLLHKDNRGSVKRLLPDSCGNDSGYLQQASAGSLINFPHETHGRQAVIVLEGSQGREGFIALATSDRSVARQLTDTLGACGERIDAQVLTRSLRRMQAGVPGETELIERWVNLNIGGFRPESAGMNEGVGI